MLKYLATIVLLLTSIGFAQDVPTPFKQDGDVVIPDILDIAYEKSYQPGDIIIVEVTSENFKNFTWQVLGPPTESKQLFKIVNGGKAVTVRSSEGSYYIFCGASKLDGTICSQLIEFTVGKPSPGPKPKPIEIPEGYLGFTKLTHDNFPSGNKKLATKLASNYRLIGSKVRSTDTPEAIAMMARNENRLILVDSDMKLLADWNKAINEKMTKSAKEYLMVTPSNHVEVYKAIAEGLELIQ